METQEEANRVPSRLKLGAGEGQEGREGGTLSPRQQG